MLSVALRVRYVLLSILLLFRYDQDSNEISNVEGRRRRKSVDEVVGYEDEAVGSLLLTKFGYMVIKARAYIAFFNETCSSWKF